MAETGFAGRKCPDCGNEVTENERHCPECGRFVRGSASSALGFSTLTGLLLVGGLVALAVVGYVWLPVLGIAAHVALWGLALSQYGGGAGRRFLSLLVFPVSLLWYDREQDDVEVRPWLFWFAVLGTLFAIVLSVVLIWLSEGGAGR
jgi:endogenous inhibitor of DNA gyrase (YacG/DUF329 family)